MMKRRLAIGSAILCCAAVVFAEDGRLALVSRTTPPVPKQMQQYPEQNGRSSGNWGHVLTDIARHLAAGARYQDAFRRYTKEGDLVTAGHEWTHFLNEQISNKAGEGWTGYYLLENRSVTLADPQGLRGIVPTVPASLRGELYDLYLVQNSSNARVDPLYLFDEWTAYANDVTVAVSQLEEGKPLNPFNREAIQPFTAGNVLEFTYYGCALGMAVKKHDPAYYASENGRKLREFIVWNAQRSIRTYRKALPHPELNSGDSRNVALMKNFRTAADTAELRAWVRSDLGEDMANLLMGLDTGKAPGQRETARGLDETRGKTGA